MTTRTLTPTLRATLRRLLKNRLTLLVNANGDITNFETYISLNPGTPHGTWHDISYTDGPRRLLAANEITTTDDGITLHTGDDTARLDSEVYDTSLNRPTPAPTEEQLVIRSHDGHNRVALNLVAATAGTDVTLPVLAAARIRGNYAGATGTESRSVTAMSTDRYLATSAALAAEPADVDALLPSSLLQELARRKSWTMTTANTVTTIEFDDLDITVTAQNLDADYPPVERLYPSHRSSLSTITVRPKHLASTLKALDVPRLHPAVLTCDGTVFSEGTEEHRIRDARATTEGDASEIIALDPRFLLKQVRAVGARWESVTFSWDTAIRPATMDWGRGIVGLIMPHRSGLTRPVEGEVAREFAA